MSTELHHSSHARRTIIAVVMCLIMAAIFVADTMTEYAVAVAVFHTAVILIAVRWLSPRTVVVLTAICIVLTLASFALTPAGLYQVGLINTGISILAIAITAYLGLKMVAAQADAHAAQARLLRIARATSLGELTASIAHEVNQPLAAVVTSGHACQRWLAQDPPQIERALQALQRILDDAERASNVITRIRGMARGDAPNRQRFELAGAIREIVALSRSELDRRGIALQWSFAPDLPDAWADRLQIQQVVGNLLLNAMESIDASQTDVVAPTDHAGSVQRVGNNISISAVQGGDSLLELTVTDSGVGLAPAISAHLFDAFWTTKSEGMGLGLTISRNMVESNGGRIWAEERSDGHRGAVFHIKLPAAAEDA